MASRDWTLLTWCLVAAYNNLAQGRSVWITTWNTELHWTNKLPYCYSLLQRLAIIKILKKNYRMLKHTSKCPLINLNVKYCVELWPKRKGLEIGNVIVLDLALEQPTLQLPLRMPQCKSLCRTGFKGPLWSASHLPLRN